MRTRSSGVVAASQIVSMSMLVFTPGCFIFVDGGMLNVGVVRDTTLVGTNDALIFAEQFEAVARRGAAD